LTQARQKIEKTSKELEDRLGWPRLAECVLVWLGFAGVLGIGIAIGLKGASRIA